jgi:methionyl-tRNA synthetase
MVQMSKICINIAWPYANGPIHLGHVAGSLLPPDIFSRYNRLLGNEVLMVGGSDQHGTPITVTAEKEGVTPEVIAERYHNINKKAIEDLNIEYSLFNKTHCPTHVEVVQKIFKDLLAKGYLYPMDTQQYYCPKCARFLPDRYVEGTCPKCGAQNVRSDQCDSCGTTFEPGDLIDAHCIHCNNTPEVRLSQQYFLKLSAFEQPLLDYLKDKTYWRSNVNTFTTNWLKDGLHDRAVTRDMSWGVPIPVEGWDDKVIYVWFEAVIGYLSASVEYSRMIGKPDYWKEFWMDPEVKHYYFIGKDNIPFHSIIWPAILMGIGGMDLPYDIPANEYLMFNGGKLSKSRGGAIDVPSVLQKYDVDAIRYYLSINMPDTHDSEFSWEDFQTKNNSELVAALGNFYHRCLSFTHKNFGKIPEAKADDKEVTDVIGSAFAEYNECISKCDFKKGLKAAMELARFGNRYFDYMKPWALIKENKEECGRVMNSLLRIVRALAIMMWPYMPSSSQKIWGYLGYEGSIEDVGYDMVSPLPVGQELKEPVPVYKKVDIPKDEPEKKEEKKKKPVPAKMPEGPFGAFRMLDLRAGQIVSIEDHPDADKLYLLRVDIGEDEPRQIVAGLKAFYTKDQMLNRRVFVVSNLKPAKLRGIMSSGMLLAADDESIGGTAVLLLKPSKDVPLGTKINCGLDNQSDMIEYKDFQKTVMKVSRVENGKFLSPEGKIELPPGAPSRVAAVIDGDKIIPLGDGKDCVATVESDILDGAGVR